MQEFTWNSADGFWYGPDLDPGDTTDYRVRLSKILSSDTISSHSVTAQNVTVATSEIDDTDIVVWLTAGIVDTVATVEVNFLTSSGRTLNRKFKVIVKDL